MKKEIIFIWIGIIFISFQACDRTTTETVRSYVLAYQDYDSIYLGNTSSSNIGISWISNSSYYDWRSKGIQKTVYDSLCSVNNDINYYKKISYIATPMYGYYFLEHITEINVTSNVDFDSSHPAGSKLNDLIRFISVSPFKFIQSGYKDTFDWNANCPASFKKELGMMNFIQTGDDNSKSHYPIDKLLSELKAADLTLLGFGNGRFIGYLLFESTPEINKTHLFTITVKTVEGKEFSRSISKIFK